MTESPSVISDEEVEHDIVVEILDTVKETEELVVMYARAFHILTLFKKILSCKLYNLCECIRPLYSC